MTQENLIERLIAENEEFRGLRSEHQGYERELETLNTKVDLTGLETAFVKTAAQYAQRKGISYAAWRELGVSADVLKQAGISRAS